MLYIRVIKIINGASMSRYASAYDVRSLESGSAESRTIARSASQDDRGRARSRMHVKWKALRMHTSRDKNLFGGQSVSAPGLVPINSRK